MIYKIATESEIPNLQSKFPPPVLEKLHSVTATLDEFYGTDRNPEITGGYTILVESAEDLSAIDCIDVEHDIFEWVDYIPSKPPHCACLYLRGDDYSLVLIAPVATMPQKVLNEVEF